ncbi:MAG: hypothetical protein AAF725_17005, partial [Acidobacteriota bacterium]
VRGVLRSALDLEVSADAIRLPAQNRGAISLGDSFAQATIGDGEHPLRVETTNGDIVLRKRSDAGER